MRGGPWTRSTRLNEIGGASLTCMQVDVVTVMTNFVFHSFSFLLLVVRDRQRALILDSCDGGLGQKHITGPIMKWGCVKGK